MKSQLRWLFAPVILACLLLMAVTSVEGKIKARTLAPVRQNYASIAVDPTGIPHAVYMGTDYHLYHAWLEGKQWKREVVDASSDCGWGNSIAVDAQGDLHVSYRAYRGLGATKLVYATFDGIQWKITDLGVEASDTVLRLDQAGQPHIAYGGNSTIQYAWFDGAAWHFEDTGLGTGPYRHDFVLDGNGHAHLAFSRNSDGHYYGTNGSGSWESTQLGTGDATPVAIAVDSRNHPHVAAGVPGSVKYYQYDGANWSSELILDPVALEIENAPVDGVAMTLDADDHAQLLVALYLGIDVSVFVFDNGMGWVGAVLDKKNAGFFPSLTLDSSGVTYGTYCTAQLRDKSKAKWVRIAWPDLAGTWDGIAVTEVDSKWNVAGTLSITNNGLDKAPKTTVHLYLSDDTQFDDGDTLLPTALKVKSLKPDTMVDVSVSFSYDSSLTGKYLIAVIDLDALTGDRNMSDNIVTVELQP